MKKFTFVNIIFFVIFGVFTGVLWAYGSPIPLIPGAVHFRTFAFIIPAIGFLFGPVSGFFAGYIGTLVWSLLGGYFIAPHTLIADGLTVALSAALPAYIMTRKKPLEKLLENKSGLHLAIAVLVAPVRLLDDPCNQFFALLLHGARLLVLCRMDRDRRCCADRTHTVCGCTARAKTQTDSDDHSAYLTIISSEPSHTRCGMVFLLS
ncbi:substrate-specific component PdxU2 of predicted pyridoxin-related ECF transporter [Sporolactobacillus inulinus]|uniref:Substrate-specific component PdxU2 of predicted pyridoxin-related ECF transporter n=1 Tax=Sporolactobacillus inulinus TaxID=2078 RepID=A0A4Y1ZC00_9BACL|nr:ECF transporter S component [Sporolactobacillus inulinus]GAY76597.1 substrate-specific component PdxU2 of predicted pyridoxin-related ECF transporter [Sporolactobacillus inulinus]